MRVLFLQSTRKVLVGLEDSWGYLRLRPALIVATRLFPNTH